MGDIGDRLLVHLRESDLAAIVKEQVGEALEAMAQAAAPDLIDLTAAGVMMGLHPRDMRPEPDDPVEATRWRKERDIKIRRAMWMRCERNAALAKMIKRQGKAIYFYRAELEQYIATLGQKRGKPRMTSIKGGRDDG